MTTCRSRGQSYIGRRHSQLLYGVPQLQGVQGSRLVVLQKPGPLSRAVRVADGERCEDRNPDGIRYLITVSEPPVTAAGAIR